MFSEFRALYVTLLNVCPGSPYQIVYEMMNGECDIFLLVYLVVECASLKSFLILYYALDNRAVYAIGSSDSKGIFYCLKGRDIAIVCVLYWEGSKLITKIVKVLEEFKLLKSLVFSNLIHDHF
jgi:hypothetical protein